MNDLGIVNVLNHIATSLKRIADAIDTKPKDIKEETLNETLSLFDKRIAQLESKFKYYG